MKNILFIMLLFPFFYYSSIMKKNSSVGSAMLKRNTDIKKIILHHVSLVDIYTTVDIQCENFEKAFNNSMKKDTITNPNEIALLEKYMHDLRAIDTLSINTVDTRAKFYFISSSDTTEYCLDSGIVYSNGNYYEISTDLFDYIENLK